MHLIQQEINIYNTYYVFDMSIFATVMIIFVAT